LIVYFGLQWIWQSVQGGDIERFVIHNATVAPAAFLVNLLTPMIQARAVEFTLQAPGGGINILNGCEGLDALFLLVSAFAVASLTWRARVIGLLSGVVVVFVVNQARILVLFYAYRASPELFNPLHAMVAPIAVVLLVCAYFYGCLFLAGRNAKSA
jgi:exosortase family protein XrtM